jgi:Flp pilus assembly protein TadD
MRPRFKYFVAGLVSLLTFSVYLSCIHNEFVAWDDDHYIYENLHLHPLNAAFFRWAFSAFYAANWHPLTWVSHALDYAVWGLNPLGHHLTNNILHAVNTFIVVVLVVKLLETWHASRQQNPARHPSQDLIIAAVTGLLFGLHPLHVESVAWVSERKDLLCAMFFLLSVLAYTNKHYLLVVFLFALALLSKPMAVSLPAVLLILDWHPFNRISSVKSFLSAFLEKLPLIALSIVSSVLTVLAQKAEGAMQPFEVTPLSSRVLVAAESLLSYLWKMVWPVNLIPYYSYPGNVSLFSAEYFLSVIIVFGITAACLIMVKKQKLWLAAWGYYVITLLPVLGIVQVGGQAMADRYTYLPSLGPFILIGLIGAELWGKYRLRGAAVAGLVIAAAILIVGSLSFLTYKQTAVWKDSLSLWSYTAARDPEDPMIHNYLGLVYINRNMLDKAMEQYLIAVDLSPDYAEAHNNLGVIYQFSNMPDKAMEQYIIAVNLKPDFADAYYNLGGVYMDLNMPDKAEEQFMTSIRLKPDLAKAHFYLGAAFYKMGQMEKAQQELARGLKIKPDDQQALELLNKISH